MCPSFWDGAPPLFYPDGRLIALKGESVGQEIEDASRLLERSHLVPELFQVRAHPESEITQALVIKRER